MTGTWVTCTPSTWYSIQGPVPRDRKDLSTSQYRLKDRCDWRVHSTSRRVRFNWLAGHCCMSFHWTVVSDVLMIEILILFYMIRWLPPARTAPMSSRRQLCGQISLYIMAPWNEPLNQLVSQPLSFVFLLYCGHQHIGGRPIKIVIYGRPQQIVL